MANSDPRQYSDPSLMNDVVNWGNIDAMDELLRNVERGSKPTIYRLSTSRRDPSQFSPRYIFLGLYNQHLGKTNRSKLRVKLEVAKAFQDTIGERKWVDICNFVVRDPEEMIRKYDESPIVDHRAVRSILTLDAIFVTCVLHTVWEVQGEQPRFNRIVRAVQGAGLSKGSIGVLLDILAVFENQIPFELVKKVVELMYTSKTSTSSASNRAPVSQEHPLTEGEYWSLNPKGEDPMASSSVAVQMDTIDVSHILNSMVLVACGLMMYYLPGPADKAPQCAPVETANYYHFLDCVYTTALQHSKEAKWDNDKSYPIATASQLKKAGIRIVRGAERTPSLRIRFDRNIQSATLVLPPLRITSWTEILLRNLLAYESLVLRRGDLICYLSFMDQLIDTEDDVFLLKANKDSVIELSLLSSDQEVANLFNSLLQDADNVALSKDWADLQREIHKFYHSRARKLWVEFHALYCRRPWLYISVVAALILLALTFLQTLYSVMGYYKD